MSEYIPDPDRSLAAIAEALERIADAQERLVASHEAQVVLQRQFFAAATERRPMSVEEFIRISEELSRAARSEAALRYPSATGSSGSHDTV
mgnify:CR=1 FL=1